MVIFIGLVVGAVGTAAVWAGTAGSEWGSTHDQFGRVVPRIPAARTRRNDVISRVVGALFLAAGMWLLFIGVTA